MVHYSMIFVGLAAMVFGSTLAMASSVCYKPGECSSIGDALMDEEALSLVQIRAGQRAKSKFVPTPGITYRMEAYITQFKSWSLDKCGDRNRVTFSRWGGVGNYSTGCLTYNGRNNWFSDVGFSNCYTSLEGSDPEITIHFEAFVNQAGDVCLHDKEDSCHIKDQFVISTTEIEDINVWLNGHMGDYFHAHEMDYVYRLIALSTTTTTTPAPAVCKVFGDPHITGFDNAKVSLLKVALLNSPEHGKINVFENGVMFFTMSMLVFVVQVHVPRSVPNVAHLRQARFV